MTATSSQADPRFGVLVERPRIWAVASIHAEVRRLEAIHDTIERRMLPRDGIVYLGNLIGRGENAKETIGELLAFRRGFISRSGSFSSDLVYLRGSQEEMWQKLLELQLAPDPVHVFEWMLDHGLGATLSAYGFLARDGIAATRGGPLAITRWTRAIRAVVNEMPGHASLLSALRRAAYTNDNKLIFVNAGIAPLRPLDEQRDSFWWDMQGFQAVKAPFGDFGRVVRGYDDRHSGLIETPFTVSLDHGTGFGGKLIAACFAQDGSIVESFEA